MSRHFVTVSVVSIVIVLVLSCYGTYRVSMARIIAGAEESDTALAGALLDHELEALLDGAEGGELRVTPRSLPAIDLHLHQFLHHFNIIRIKIFDRHARIIYSTEPALVGRDDPGNRRLAEALAGRSSSEAMDSDDLDDFNGRETFDVNVVETYIPVRNRAGRVVGVFEMYTDVTPSFRKVLPFVAVTGSIVGVVLSAGFLFSYTMVRRRSRQLQTAQEALWAQATTDALTGLYNRRYLLERCAAEYSRMERQRQRTAGEHRIGFIMLDIDHFKRVNDSWGHAVGDAVLAEVAERLRRGVRQHDIVGRYGGEEFLVVLPDTDGDQLRVVAERLWQEVRATPVRCGGREIAVTISLGAAADGDDESCEAVIRRADEALYRSKNEGRDRITYL